MYSIQRYDSTQKALWDDLVGQSKNGTFLFRRDFMEYHSDRFADFSLIVFKNETPIAILPAHIKDNVLHSHWGLTYGGLVYSHKIKLAEVIQIVRALLAYLDENNIRLLHIKEIPSIYHKHPADEMKYALFLAKAELLRRDSLCVIDNASPLPFTKTRKESIRRGAKNNLVIKEEPAFGLFWEKILIPNLDLKHAAKPVHTADEITLLHSRFPENIRHFNVYHNDTIVAGTTVFITDTVAHPQYISGNADKNELGSLDFLYNHLITNVFKDKRFFDFGISNEAQGRKLNAGLVFWKESFGARTLVQDFYEVQTANYPLLDNVML